MPLHFQNFLAASRKPNMLSYGFNMFAPGTDLSWIDAATSGGGGGGPIPSITVAFASSISIETSSATPLIASILLTGDVTSTVITYLSGPTPPQGTQLFIRVQQDGTGGHAFTLPTNLFNYPAYSVDQRANYVTILPVVYNAAAAMWEYFGSPFSFPVA